MMPPRNAEASGVSRGTGSANGYVAVPSDYSILPHHQRMLDESAITPEVASARGYRSVTDPTELADLGFALNQRRVPGLLVPIHDIYGQVSLYQLRPDDSRLNDKGKPIKYESPRGSRMVLDIPPMIRDQIGNPNAPLWITEGVKKADAAVSAGLCCIALVGVWNWRGSNAQGGTTALGDFEAIHLKGRDVIVAFDNDVMVKDGVRKALERLSEFLRSRGAKVQFCYLPDADGRKLGLDDYLAEGHTVEELRGHVEKHQRLMSLALDDFLAYMPDHKYIFVPTGELWPASSVNQRIKPVQVGTNDDGKPIKVPASTWLDQNQPVEQMTWSPGEPERIDGRLISQGGWIERPGSSVFNRYRPPILQPGEADKAERWVEHIHVVYPEEADHIIQWLAHRIQKPGEKINHAMVLGGAQGIGKDTILEPVKHAVGPWNFEEISPTQLLGRFNPWVQSVILRVSEARDLGDIDRYSFYEHLKVYTAAPPDVLRCDEKYLREYHVLNVCGVVITTNHLHSGLYLPADDRRHFVAWSERTVDDFDEAYWSDLYGWYEDGGHHHVAAYLEQLDLSGFNPKAPPRKTAAFWDIVTSNLAPEDAELSDILDKRGWPMAITISEIVNYAGGDLKDWLTDRKNSRQIPHRMEEVGYVRVRNSGAKDGLWKTKNKRQVIYARKDLPQRERIAFAQELIGQFR